MPPDLKPHDVLTDGPPPASWLEERRQSFPSPPLTPPPPSAHPKRSPITPTPATQSGKQRSTQRSAQIALAFLVAVFVGASMFLAEPFQHRCAATLQMANASDRLQLNHCRKELIAFLWSDDRKIPRPQSLKWQVEVPATGTLRIATESTNADAATTQAETLAKNFLTHIQSLNDSELNTPTESETQLQDYVALLTRRLDDAQSQLDAAMARLPAADPRPDHTALADRWQSARGDFESARAQLRQAAAEYKTITQHDPANAAPTPEARQAALLADTDLQQDRKELATTLTELKLHMLNVWQESSSSLDQLAYAAATGQSQLAKLDTAEIAPALRDAYSAIAAEMTAYRDAAAAFAKSWNAEFAAIQRADSDPDGAALLDAYQRVKTLLSEFLFHAGNRLAAIRENVNKLSRDPADDAQHHLRQSDAARAFAELQSAHHRFEFAAGALDTPTNFRLDSALRIARGLRRRVNDRTREIDDRLQKEAAARAQAEQTASLAALDEILRNSRDATDATVEELIALQDGLQTASASSEQFVAAVAAAELANNRLHLTRADLDQAETQLRELTEKRAAAQRASELQFVSAGILQKNINLEPRLRTATVGASVTFLAVLLGQILLARSLWPQR